MSIWARRHKTPFHSWTLYIYNYFKVISECSLKRVGNLGFDLETGTCGVYNFEVNDELILCFSGTDDKSCQR